jgi:hypothetical protein
MHAAKIPSRGREKIQNRKLKTEKKIAGGMHMAVASFKFRL